MIRLALIAILTLAGFLALPSPAVAAKLPCLTKDQAMDRGESPRYRDVPGLGRCWYVGKRTVGKHEFEPPRKAAVKVKPVKPAKSSSGGVEGHARYADQPCKALGCRARETVSAPPTEAGAGIKPGPLETNTSAPPPIPIFVPHADAPDQARLERAFNEIRTLWSTWHMAPWAVNAIYGLPRLDYAQRWPAWEMAGRWP